MRVCKRGHDLDVHQNHHRQCRECMRLWRQEHPDACLTIGKNYARRNRMANLYHITEEQYAAMYADQKGLCILPACGQPATDIDHCHKLNRTRGLMCNRHNLALGLFNDDPILLRQAAEYLEKFNG